MELDRYVLHLSYLGTNYSGWQIQENAKSIQGAIMLALHSILSSDITLMTGAGRTDTGVHAVNFFAHFDYHHKMNTCDLKYKLNRFLAKDIVIHSINSISKDFHARFSATSRKYEYWISTVKDPFLINRAYFFSKKLNLQIMNEASQKLVGKHNFSTFSKGTYDNPNCDVTMVNWIKSKNMLFFSIEADRFLYNMVRCIVGTLIDLGLGKISLSQFDEIRYSGDRIQSGFSVPAEGLYLMNVNYPKSYNFECI